MQNSVIIKNDCPFDNSSFFSQLFFTWMIPLFKKGYNKELEFTDLHKYCAADDPRKVSDCLEKNWNKELNRQHPSIVRAIAKSFGLKYTLFASILLFTECLCKTFQPLLIGMVVKSFSASGMTDETIRTAYLAAMGICTSTIIETFGRNHYQLLVRRIALNCRTGLTILVYKKILRLKTSVLFEKTSVGQIINILANDLNRFDELGHIMIYIIIAPLQSIIVMYFLLQQLGWSACGGLIILFLFIPFQGLMGRLFNTFRRKTTQITDKRIKLMGEIISAIKLIKVYCWEQPFVEVISKIRNDEIRMMKWSAALKSTNSALFFVACRIMLFASLIVFILQGGALTAETVFVTMALFNALRIPVTNQFPNAVGLSAESLVACKRIQNILLLEEKPTNNLDKFDTEHGSIKMKKYSGKWSRNLQHNNLTGIDLTVHPGQLVVAVGSVGSGKTCFLHALLNEIETVSGQCKLNGRTSYASQEAWCFTGFSIRDNITLGEKIDYERYDRVLRICCLDKDLALFPEYDQTVVGENTLSGGQKARVSLARCVYNDADVYLLDDPLSAVDPHVANHIFEECIQKFLSGKTVILVTHQIQFARKADRVVVFDDGRISTSGTFAEVSNHNPELFSNVDEDDILDLVPKRKNRLRTRSTSSTTSLNERPTSYRSQISHRTSIHCATEDEVVLETADSEPDNDSPSAIKGEEQRSTGSVKGAVYWQFIRAGATIPIVFLLPLILVTPQVIFHFTDLWIAGWTQDYETDTNRTASFESEKKNVIIYSSLVVGLFSSSFIRVIFLYLVTLKCSVQLHRRIFHRLLRAPMNFFERNQVGRILNRFTRDLGQVDQRLPAILDDLISTLLNVIAIMITTVIVSPYLVIPAIVLIALSIPFRRVYLRTARDMQRLDAIAKSPLYSHIASTVDGITPIRAFRLEQQFEEQYFAYLKDSTSVKFLVIATGRAYSFFLDSFACLYICSISIFLVVYQGSIPGGAVGLVLSQTLVLIGLFQLCIRKTADFETAMVSVERVLEYGKLPTEESLTVFTGEETTSEIARQKISKWPKTGKIKFRNVSVSYGGEFDYRVLRDLSFTVKGGQKVGIVGRTGAGKSSIISVLFRLIEPQGEVVIDNVDTQIVGLHELRSKISIIPQDPILFSGTIRRNLDPFNEYADCELWSCLTDANLVAAVKVMPGGLDACVSEGGSNLSVGQRQLLCLARALLKNNKILVMDEATANVDLETDELIQRTIKTKFKDCTVLTVAHRLNTIIDMDKVLVLDAGKVVEFDEPYILLTEKTGGYFDSMVKQTGDQCYQLLLSAAKKAFYARLECPAKC